MAVSGASINPYESPQVADAATQLDQSTNQVGAKVVTNELIGTASIYRLAAAIVDEAAATLLFFVAAMFLATTANLQGISIVAGAVMWLGYFFMTEWLMGATPGKLLTGLRVRQSTGERCTMRQIAVRTLLRLVEVNPLICGLFPAGIAVNCTARHQRLGDLLAGTLVVRKSQQKRSV
jgi:uncharacterized RDD family membrane protein YckC